jgi:pimeloyl-ACP methyl ester carboxylesterase
MIPSLDLGGAGPDLHFANANGYPVGAYRRLLATLTPRYHVQAMVARPLWAGSQPEALESWEPLVDDLVQYLDERGARGWIGVGHSLGAVVSAAAALRRPELFRALVLIEPVFVRPSVLALYAVFQKLGLAARVHPLVPGARRRRRAFESAEAMFARYRRAPVFAGLDDDALRDYTTAALRPGADGASSGGLALAYSPEWEARVYETGPLNLWGRLHQLKLPVLAIRGANTDTFSRAGVRALRRRLPQAEIVEVAAAGHLLPLEKPEEVGRIIQAFLEKALGDSHSGSGGERGDSRNSGVV